MAIVELKVPSPGESITEVVIARWVKNTGDVVEKDEVLAEIDSDKATLTLNAEEAGKIEVLAAEGDTVMVGQVVVKIDTSVKPEAKTEAPKAEKKEEVKAEAKKEEPKKDTSTNSATDKTSNDKSTYATGTPSIAAAKLMAENNIQSGQMNGTGKDGRITKQDVLAALSNGLPTAAKVLSNSWQGGRDKERTKMTSLRKTVAKRLVAVKNETAMLTTFNEVDMSEIYAIRAKYKDKFKEVY
jgi:2-oxoglutarate dehydrogenase E2 component (dihydrolipoamide succinyltransferase)